MLLLFLPMSVIPKLALLLLSLVLLVVGRCIYNRYFHPLARFPGPFWASMTDAYLILNIKAIPLFGNGVHRRYGTLDIWNR